MREPIEILELLTSASQAGKRMVLATIVDVQGSAYRQVGAHLLLVEDGRKAGSISSGCLENDLIARGDEIFDLSCGVLLEYESDELFGLNDGCDGTIQILVQPVTNQSSLFPYAFHMAEELAESLGLATVLESNSENLIGTQVLFSKNKILTGNSSRGITQFVSENLAEWISRKRRCECFEFDGTRVFVELVKPTARLAIFGAGEDVAPLVTIARTIGFEPHIIDSRRSYIERFEQSVAVHHYESDFQLPLEFDAIVVMSHNFELDKRFLSCALKSTCDYIGVMGSRKRTEKILTELQVREVPARIKYPIGLDLGADSPEEIALSICSEILAFFRCATGRSLCAISGHIHQKADKPVTKVLSSVKELRLISCATGNQHE